MDIIKISSIESKLGFRINTMNKIFDLPKLEISEMDIVAGVYTEVYYRVLHRISEELLCDEFDYDKISQVKQYTVDNLLRKMEKELVGKIKYFILNDKTRNTFEKWCEEELKNITYFHLDKNPRLSSNVKLSKEKLLRILVLECVLLRDQKLAESEFDKLFKRLRKK